MGGSNTKTAGRKNFGALSSRGFCTMRGSVCRPSQEWVTGTQISGIAFLIGGAAAIISDPTSPHSGQQKTSGECFLPLLKCRRDTESAPVPSNAASCERPGCRRCSASQGAGEHGKHGFPGYFCLSYMFSLRQVGKKTDISLSCPMSRGAKQDLPFA